MTLDQCRALLSPAERKAHERDCDEVAREFIPELMKGRAWSPERRKAYHAHGERVLRVLIMMGKLAVLDGKVQ
jgi:hypothetical protein